MSVCIIHGSEMRFTLGESQLFTLSRERERIFVVLCFDRHRLFYGEKLKRIITALYCIVRYRTFERYRTYYVQR